MTGVRWLVAEGHFEGEGYDRKWVQTGEDYYRRGNTVGFMRYDGQTYGIVESGPDILEVEIEALQIINHLGDPVQPHKHWPMKPGSKG